jgi:hypothetical protein
MLILIPLTIILTPIYSHANTDPCEVRAAAGGTEVRHWRAACERGRLLDPDVQQ